jgi:hypothetical protein
LEREVAKIVLKAYLCSGREMPTKEEGRAIVGAWCEILSVIPPSDIQSAYVEALRNRSFAGLVTPNEIVAAWVELREQAATRRRQAESQRQLDAMTDSPLPPEEIREIIGRLKDTTRVKAWKSVADVVKGGGNGA